MRILLTGATGQLGVEVLKSAPGDAEVTGLSHQDCDITVPSDVEDAMARHRPALVINAAAFTAVDDAEKKPEVANAVNALGAGNVARAAEKAGARVIHISTDYVFDGASREPYTPDAPTNPLNEYGRTKAAGERQIAASSSNFLIIRSGWLYASHGRNFFRTILSALEAGRPLRVVADQIGVPTSARGLANVIWKCAAMDASGIWHWADEGSASWFDFAAAIQDAALARGLIANQLEITAVSTDQYPTPAKRPAYSVLDARPLWQAIGKPPHWKRVVEQTISERVPQRD